MVWLCGKRYIIPFDSLGCPPHNATMSPQSGRSPNIRGRGRGRLSASPRSFNSLELPLDNSSTDQSSQRRNQSSPNRDPACENCAAPATERHCFNRDLKGGRYAYGEIIAINESVHAPIDQLFAVPSAHSTAVMSTSSLGLRPRGDDKNPRPGVVLSIPQRTAKDSNGTKVRLMAGFINIYKLDDLPPVLQQFCMPVSPHYEIGMNVEHLHTTPEWQKDHAWLILPPYVSSRAVQGRWRWRDANGKRPEGCSFEVDNDTLSQLENIYVRRFKEWSEKCSEEGYREERHKEYQVSCGANVDPST